jgi:hypothetical protein
MSLGQKHRRRLGGGAVLLTLLLALAGAGSASAAVPTIDEVWASQVFSSTARLQAEVDPNGLATGYHIDYIAKAAYEANVSGGKDPFTGTPRIPSASDASVGSGLGAVSVLQLLFGLSPETTYRYRLVAKNSSGTVTSPTLIFATQGIGGVALPDNRGWEMVSPVDKNGGDVAAPGAIADGGVLQAAVAGGAVTYGAPTSFGAGAGAATASQYIATRSASGWSTQNITPPLYSASYNTKTEGVPHQIFSGDLARALLLNGRHCRGEGSDCAVPNPPLAATDAPAGYQNYYLWEGGAFTALLGAANAGSLALEPAEFELRLAGASPDLRHPVLSSCAALTSNATEVPLGEGCDPAQQNLYEYSPGAGLSLVNLLPAQGTGSPGSALASPSGAVSTNGTRVYFTQGGSLFQRDGSTTKRPDEAAGGGGSFQVAAGDGSVAYFTKGEHLWRYEAAGAGSATDITPSGGVQGVQGVLGASENGAHLYYLTAAGLFLWHSGATTKVADTADSSNDPPASGTARVSADGTRLLFVSTSPLTGYDNEDLNTGLPDSQVYLYDATGAGSLTCVSCNPTFERPIGASSIPGARANGSAPGSTEIYKPRVLSADGRRVFFESADAIAAADTNNQPDVYQWEAQGSGNCTRPGGCAALISSGRAKEGAVFLDASADGADAFFLTDGSLVSADNGAVDLYDARIGGGFPEPQIPLACEGDACQPLPSPPTNPTLTTLLSGPGNPAVRYPNSSKGCKKGQVKRKGKCVKAKAKKAPKKGAKRSGR